MRDTAHPQVTQESSTNVVELAQKVSGAKARTEWLDDLSRNYKSMPPLNFAVAVRLGAVHFNCATGQCNPGPTALANALGCKKGSIKDALRELQRDGWIWRNHTDGGDHENKAQIDLLSQRQRGGKLPSRVEADGVAETQGTGWQNGHDGVAKTGGTGWLVAGANEQLNRKEEQSAAPAARSARVERESVNGKSAPPPSGALAISKEEKREIYSKACSTYFPRGCSATDPRYGQFDMMHDAIARTNAPKDILLGAIMSSSGPLAFCTSIASAYNGGGVTAMSS